MSRCGLVQEKKASSKYADVSNHFGPSGSDSVEDKLHKYNVNFMYSVYNLTDTTQLLI